MGKIIFNDEPYGSSYNNAKNISYDNTDSGLNAKNLQASTDELKALLVEKDAEIATLQEKVNELNSNYIVISSTSNIYAGQTITLKDRYQNYRTLIFVLNFIHFRKKFF